MLVNVVHIEGISNKLIVILNDIYKILYYQMRIYNTFIEVFPLISNNFHKAIKQYCSTVVRKSAMDNFVTEVYLQWIL